MDGLWSDALSERAAEREAATHRRCADLLQRIDRPAEDEGALRALSAPLVEAVERQLWRTSLDDKDDAGHGRELVTLLDGVAGASREMLAVHRVVDTVKAAPRAAQERREEMAGIAQQLRDAAALRSLLRVGGPFASEARTLGLVFALDRMDLAGELPIHLKLDVTSGVFLEVFRVSAPKASGAPRDTWLAYLSDVAAGAGHPVPAQTSAATREAEAWDSVLQGFADRLRAGAGVGPLANVARGVADRIDAAHVH
jgi:hypothetical protein